MSTKPPPGPFDPEAFLTAIRTGKSVREYRPKQAIFSQGDAADAVFYLQRGKVKLTVVSHTGKEAVVALLELGSFVGEGCLAGQPLRMATATAMEEGAAVVRLERKRMILLLRAQPAFAQAFLVYLLSRNIRIEADLVDQLFNSAEKRLARILLLMARYGKEGKSEEVVAKISQETLAEMIGTTRSRVSYFMNRFRKLGFIEYASQRTGARPASLGAPSLGRLKVHDSLLNIVLHD
ncbi:MAG TPA: Crp/Fnr family transcriptional regulator [Terriglobales bacterium]|nr:Crp/Fnr family transcriptional regulator [Terriglobales bacterium]